jgi:hypothetical protein
LLYLAVGFFINRLSLAPIACPENPDLPVPPREAHRYDGIPDPTETEVALLATAMTEVFSNYAQRIEKRMLGKLEPDTMLGPVDLVLCGVPFKVGYWIVFCMYMLPYFCMAKKA